MAGDWWLMSDKTLTKLVYCVGMYSEDGFKSNLLIFVFFFYYVDTEWVNCWKIFSNLFVQEISCKCNNILIQHIGGKCHDIEQAQNFKRLKRVVFGVLRLRLIYMVHICLSSDIKTSFSSCDVYFIGITNVSFSVTLSSSFL